MRKVGMFGFDDINEHDPWFYLDETKDEKIFYLDKEGTKVASDEDLYHLALVLNSPWDKTYARYTIKLNTKSENPKWICAYNVIGYDGIYSIAMGYGDTEEEALKDCKDLFKYLQENFNKNNERF